jgi:hypothetical protein
MKQSGSMRCMTDRCVLYGTDDRGICRTVSSVLSCVIVHHPSSSGAVEKIIRAAVGRMNENCSKSTSIFVLTADHGMVLPDSQIRTVAKHTT